MQQKQFFIVVAVIQNAKGEILLAKRNEPLNTYAHNKWELIGGGIEYGENPIDALKREVKEEAGVEIEVKRLLPKIVTHLWQEAGHQIIMMAYECKIIAGELKPGLDQEIKELKYVPLEEIKKIDGLPKLYEVAALIYS